MNNNKPRDIKERTFTFALEIVRLCQRFEKCSDVSRTLGKQLLRSGTSIGANVEEAQAGQSMADFVSKYTVALKEARETIYWLRLFRASDSSKADQLDALIQEAGELSRIIGSIVVSAKKGKTK
ncbi:MAG: four helix bundle protein [Nitrospira sp.]|nr:four helix bundle protein [Nitrospira sp.]MCP9476207.1 four helix bundle protein [Nitrospira sp.]